MFLAAIKSEKRNKTFPKETQKPKRQPIEWHQHISETKQNRQINVIKSCAKLNPTQKFHGINAEAYFFNGYTNNNKYARIHHSHSLHKTHM